MGGAAGHLNHIHDDISLTFQELKQLIYNVLQGRLNYKEEPVEKIDGYNLYVTVVEGEVKIARNKTTLLKPMSLSDIEQKYKESDNAFTISIEVIQQLQKIINEFPSEFINDLFVQGQRFLSTEVLLGDTQNVIPYNLGPFLIFHALVQYDEQGNLIAYSTRGARTFYKLLEKTRLIDKSSIKIIPQKVISLKQVSNSYEYQNMLYTLLNKLQKEFNLQDSDTISSYYKLWWEKYIDDNVPNISTSIKDQLVNRWALGDRSFRIFSKYFDNVDIYQVVKNIDTTKQKDLQNSNYEKFENIFLQLGTILIYNQNDFLSQENVNFFRNQVLEYILGLKSSLKNEDELKKAMILLKKIKLLGGIDKLMPCEGIIFYYKNKAYKLTGMFSPLNKLFNIAKK